MKSPERPRVGIHEFLNSRPILYPFLHGLVETPFTLVTDSPANLAQRFAKGDLDIALIPSIEYGRNEDAVISPALCIASLGRVDTVLLFSEMAIDDMETVCVDPRSSSSVAMLKIIFQERFKRDIITITGETDPAMMLRSADAGLIIGDSAFSIDREKYITHDLGEMWYQHCGRPFVHALLCAHKGAKWPHALSALAEAKEIGKSHIDLIARQTAKTREEAERNIEYLTTRIRYDLNKDEIDGAQYFLETATRKGLCQRSALKFYKE
jgi:chorismate dehydratase